jgi:hypothetical protein
LWDLKKQSLLNRRCSDLARAQALLLSAPEKARARAAALLLQAPDWLAAKVLHGRASLRLGDTASALAELSPLLASDASGVVDPATLLDGGRAALRQRDLASAARFYRTLGSRAAVLPDRKQQVIAYLEIAGTLLVSEGAPLDDVLAYLREARRRSAGSGLTGLCAGMTAVAWLAQGREAEAQGALSEVTDVSALKAFESGQDVWLPEGLWHAVMGVVLERAEPELSAAHFRAVAASPLVATAVGKLGNRGGKRPISGWPGKREAK